MPRPRVVIVGGGFAGAFTAKYLRKYAKDSIEIELINAENYFVFQPLLPEVASGTISAPDAVTPLRYMLPGVKFRMAEVTHVDADAKRVHFLQGSRRVPQSVAYDQLVLAVGQKTNLSFAPGLAEHSVCMRNLADAHQLRNKIIRRLEHADVTEDAELKQRLLTFVVGGGGFSGVETIGEVAEMVARTLKFYPNIATAEVRHVLVQRGPRLLEELPERLGLYAQEKLAARGIDIRLNTSIASATGNDVYLDDGTSIPSCLLVTTVGNGPSTFTTGLGINLERGKIPVDANLRAIDRDDTWALGDAALIPLPSEDGEPRFAPPTAQFATREAKCVAKNIVRSLAGEAPEQFDFTPQGSLASIGNYKGVAQIFGLRLSGLIAWMLWRFLYIGMLPGFATRLRVALNWGFDYFLPRSIVQIANQTESATLYRYFAKGDTVSFPGQRVDGFYTVTEGCLESRIPVDGEAEDFVRVIGPGDHWGERSLSNNTTTLGTLTATDNTRVMVLKRRDFNNLRNTFPALDDYFKSINDKIYAPHLRQQKEPTCK
ncbi:MAG: FAD-dependent oxidoreductase [Pseudomonadota bacterium]